MSNILNLDKLNGIQFTGDASSDILEIQLDGTTKLKITNSNNLEFSSFIGKENAILDNLKIGENTLIDPSLSGGLNIAIGTGSQQFTSTGYSNTSVGRSALQFNTTGYFNTAIGTTALQQNTTGYNNSAVGRGALNCNTTGYDNSALGREALYNNYTGFKNTGIGVRALGDNEGGSYNTGVGRSAGGACINGNGNTSVGYGANSTGTTGSYNTCLGHNAEPSTVTASGQFVLGDSNVTSLRCNVTSISSLSDARDKKDITDNPYGLDFINSIKSRQFTWETREGNMKDGETNLGFIAQELLEATNGNNNVLDLVYQENPERLEIKQGNLIPILVKAIQELSEKVNQLQN